MHRHPAEHLEQKECHEGQKDEQDPVLHRALGLLIHVDRLDEANTEVGVEESRCPAPPFGGDGNEAAHAVPDACDRVVDPGREA